ncbi:MAG: hypothetical protein MUE81_04660 [Thermoflexibacter sp.]|jgi:hypothetical protein|nr:hypothetical protein [Thermoflexibacter sp.]
MKIFETYTGNAMLNNALMTIEALAKLKNVSDISPALLLELYEKHDLRAINKRLKSYTMLFSLNNPLVNPAKKQDNAGEKTYHNLLVAILNDFDNQGARVCEISGLRFEKTFEDFYRDEIENQKKAIKSKGLDSKEEKKLLTNIDNTDSTLNRSWFPLIGGLGSDAQALPQAKFTIQIHPICIVIMQFLPLSALLYKGGVLLIDSSNFEFARGFISKNVKILKGRIETTSVSNSVENVKDFSKGNYLLMAIEILGEKEIDETYSDLNFWSFSNSGTGASCEIDRVPNSLIQKLMRMKGKSKISNELTQLLSNKESSYSFLENLEDNTEWYLLYPNVFGSGNKKVEYEGVSVNFLETYFKEIGSSQKIEYAKYLAYLIDKYKTESFAKYLGKRDAHKEKEFHTDLYAVLIKATENGEWDLVHHFGILDNSNTIPVKNSFYQILKITHFYYYKKVFSSEIPTPNSDISESQKICEWLLAFIQQDTKKESIIKDLLSPQNYLIANYTNIFYRVFESFSLDLESIFYALFDEEYQSTRFGINGLLRIFFNQTQQNTFEVNLLEKPKTWELDRLSKKWFSEIEEFAQNYQAYYFDKYENKETGSKPYGKFLNLINAIPNENSQFLIWFYEAVENTNEFIKGEEKKIPDKWSDSLLYAPNGEYTLSFARFAIKFSLLKQYQKASNQITKNNL